jgi:hypothetical protein
VKNYGAEADQLDADRSQLFLPRKPYLFNVANHLGAFRLTTKAS